MSRLSDLLERAFENKGNKNRYSEGPWSLGFDERAWDTRFELYHDNVPVMEGNTLDKELKLTNGSAYPIEKLIPEVEKALPEYHFNVRVEILIPVDFNDYWTREVENAEYEGIVDECRYEDISDGYGYDVVAYTVPRLSDVKDIVITHEGAEKYTIDSWEMRMGQDGEVEVSPLVYAPAKESQHTQPAPATSLSEKIREAEKRAEKLPESSVPEKGKEHVSRKD